MSIKITEWKMNGMQMVEHSRFNGIWPVYELVRRLFLSLFCKHDYSGASSDKHPFCTNCGIREASDK